MCEYVDQNVCRITKEVCPWMYLCPQTGEWRANNYMPADCKVKRNVDIPTGYCRVREERKGWLYVDLGEQTIRVKNPFDHTPLYVRVRKLKSGEYKLRE